MNLRSSTTVLFGVLLSLLSITPVDSTFGPLICSALKRAIPPPASCPTCAAGFKFLTVGLYGFIGCSLGKVTLSSDFPPVYPSFEGKYYQRGQNSKTSIGFVVNGTYQNYTIPSGINVSISVTHAAPISFTDPIDFVSCTAKVKTTDCVCTICDSGNGVALDCSKFVLVPKGSVVAGFLPANDITFPNTSSYCLSPTKLAS